MQASELKWISKQLNHVFRDKFTEIPVVASFNDGKKKTLDLQIGNRIATFDTDFNAIDAGFLLPITEECIND